MITPIEQNTIDLESILAAVNSLPEGEGGSGVELPTLTDPGKAEDLMSGKELIDENGSVITGIFTLDDEIAEQDSLIDQIATALRDKASGGSSDIEISLLTREITEYSNPTLTKLGAYALSGTNITSLNLPALTTIAGYAFYECTKLTTMVFPLLQEVPYNGCRQFKGLVKADFHALKSIGANAFYQASNLETLIIRTNSLCTLASGTVLTATKIQSGTGYIYVPAALVDTYKAATNWSAFADRFRAIEDYPDICG